jgi:CrcB protein
VVGSFVLGLVTGLPASPTVLALVGTGFCGALTTYSTFGYETLRLAQERARMLALANILVSVIAGLGAAATGVALAHAVT